MNKDGGVDLKQLLKEGQQARIEENSAPMTQEDQCRELINTVKARIAPSKVHGVGVFALKDIAAGETLYCALTSRPQWYRVSYSTLTKHLSVRPELLQLILDRWPNVVNEAPFLSPNYDQRLTSFMNHSDDPNYSPFSDRALRDIKAGEEIFENYRTMENWEKAYPWLSTPTVDTKKRKRVVKLKK